MPSPVELKEVIVRVSLDLMLIESYRRCDSLPSFSLIKISSIFTLHSFESMDLFEEVVLSQLWRA